MTTPHTNNKALALEKVGEKYGNAIAALGNTRTCPTCHKRKYGRGQTYTVGEECRCFEVDSQNKITNMNTPDTEELDEDHDKAEQDARKFFNTTPDTEWEKEIRNAGDFHTEAPVVHASNVRKLLSYRDTYWKERVEEIWHDLGKYQGWLGGVMGNETDSTLMQHPPTKEVREAKALHTAIILKAKEKVHQTQMKVKSLLDNLK